MLRCNGVMFVCVFVVGGLDVTSSVFGLFPRPYGRSAKSTLMSKVRARFRLLGKLLARALMDNRTLDLSLGEPFYKWLLLGQQCCLNADDLRLVDPDLHRIFCRFQQLVERKKQLEADTSLVSRKRNTHSVVD